jgi:hypothetical protein
MEQSCHRCGTAVSRRDAFCPVCGAPQLHFDESEQAAYAEGAEAAVNNGRPGQVSWKIVIGLCGRIAIPAGILCALPLLSLCSLIWVAGGASMVIFLYCRKRPMTLLSTKGGFRIGALTGFVIAYVSIAVTAILHVVQRFPLHAGAVIDETYEELIRSSTSVFETSPETQAQMQSFFHFLLTPDGRAVWSLTNMAFLVAFTVVIAAIGGAVGVRMFAGRRVA